MLGLILITNIRCSSVSAAAIFFSFLVYHYLKSKVICMKKSQCIIGLFKCFRFLYRKKSVSFLLLSKYKNITKILYYVLRFCLFSYYCITFVSKNIRMDIDEEGNCFFAEKVPQV